MIQELNTPNLFVLSPSLGDTLLHLALVACILSVAVPVTTIRTKTVCLIQRVIWSFIFIYTFLSMMCLIHAFVVSDFSVLNVVDHSSRNQPIIYKISAAWGSHQGSMLLWINIVSLISFIFAHFIKCDSRLFSYTLSVQAFLNGAFILFTISTSNPFERGFPAFVDGYGLTPILQDIAISFHPPTLYGGYVGFSIVYAIAVAGLIANKMDKEWCRVIYPFVMLSWGLQTFGIGSGSWWAYKELGWGGYWFWDPVENASLLPWITATSLIHTLSVMRRTGGMKYWCIFLAIATFTLSLLGTFIVRSGIITSVHSFALDEACGRQILFFILLLNAPVLLLFFRRILTDSDRQGQSHPFFVARLIRLGNYLFLITDSPNSCRELYTL